MYQRPPEFTFHLTTSLNTRPPAELEIERLTKRSGAGVRAPRSRLAGKVERVLNAVLSGESNVVLNVSGTELLAEAGPVGAVISSSLARSGPGVTAQWRLTEPFRRTGLSDELFNSLVAANPLTRAAAARLCASLRLPESAMWIADLLDDPNVQVREAAVRSLGRFGGRRAVDALMAAHSRISLHRLAIALAMAASDIEIESLMRQPASEKAAVATVLACGLRRDRLRIPPLLGIASDRRWPRQVRVAACRAVGMIGDPAGVPGLSATAAGDPDDAVRNAAGRSVRRLTYGLRSRVE
jgi:HEAT repeat protein